MSATYPRIVAENDEYRMIQVGPTDFTVEQMAERDALGRCQWKRLDVPDNEWHARRTFKAVLSALIPQLLSARSAQL